MRQKTEATSSFVHLVHLYWFILHLLNIEYRCMILNCCLITRMNQIWEYVHTYPESRELRPLQLLYSKRLAPAHHANTTNTSARDKLEPCSMERPSPTPHIRIESTDQEAIRCTVVMNVIFSVGASTQFDSLGQRSKYNARYYDVQRFRP
jgi:hypothetical protein